MPESMTEKRLTGIALIHIHYAKTVDLNNALLAVLNVIFYQNMQSII
jgi:hypothetical protein